MRTVFRPADRARWFAAEVTELAEADPIPEFTGDPADDRSFDLAGETYLHGCRILAAGRSGARLEIHLLATAIDQVNLAAPLREPAVAATGVDTGTAEGGRSLEGPSLERPAVDQPPAISLSQRFVLTFADEVAAISEAIVIDHWGESGILVEGHVSGLQQGVMLFDPATGISTGIRLALGN